MPPLPTSLSVVALVVAWLVVLVPMAARRREHVPDSDERSGRFRVLRRSSRRRRRPVLSRTAVTAEDAAEFYEGDDGVDPMDEQTLWSDEDEFDESEYAADEDDVVSAGGASTASVAARTGRPDDRRDQDDALDEGDALDKGDEDLEEQDDLAESLFDEDDDLDELDDVEDEDELPTAQAARRAPAGQWDAADEWAAEHTRSLGERGMERVAASRTEPAALVGPAASLEGGPEADPRVRRGRVIVSRGDDGWRTDSGASGDPSRAAAVLDSPVRPAVSDGPVPPAVDIDPAALRPVPRRPGRGGFDPEAAAKAKAYRYRRRRRVALVLLFATVVFTLVSVFVVRAAWAGAVVCGILLVGYLAYLRRQVRIEESIRQRRTARLAQARQLRPDYGREPGAVREEPAARDQVGYRDDPRAASAAAVPPSQYRSGTVVDLDDDDPAFSDLEYHQPLTYRRASGQ